MLPSSSKPLNLQGLSDDSLEAVACQLLYGKGAFSTLFPRRESPGLDELAPEALEELKTESRFVAARARLSKVILKRVLQTAAQGRGLDPSSWSLIEQARESLLVQADPGQKTLLAALAWEAGFYALTLDFGHQDPFEAAYSALMIGRREAYQAQLALLDSSSPFGALKRTALAALKMRVDGEHLKSAALFESEIETTLQKLLNSSEGETRESDIALSEIMMIGATTYFYIAQYSKSVHLNTRAHESLAFVDAPSRAAVAAFNAGIAANHLNQSEQVSQWIARTREHLSSYQVPGLHCSLLLFDAERSTGAGNYDRALKLADSLLENPSLSATQRIVAHQTRGRVLTELGRLIDAEVSLVQARGLIAQSSFQQFYVQQSALELEIQNYTFRQSVGVPKDAGKHVTARSNAWLKLALIRSAIADGNRALVEKRFNDFSVETPFALQTTMYKRDIEIQAMKLLATPENRPRAMLAQVLLDIEQNNVSHLQYLLETWGSLVSSPPLAAAAIALARTVVSLEKGDAKGAQEQASQASELCERHGLDRVQAILLAVLASLDPASRSRWTRLYRSIPSVSRDWLKQLLIRLVDSSVFSNTWTVTSDAIDVSHPGETGNEVDLIIDQNKGSVSIQGKELELSGQSVLFRLLVQIALSQSQGLDKSRIVQLTWGFTYNPSAHDSLIYVNVRRLRQFVPIELYEGRYRLSNRITWKVITNSSLEIEMKAKNLSERQLAIVNLARFSSQQNVSRRDVAHGFRISPRTALRELTELVELGFLSRSNKGRSATYFLKGHGV